MSHPTVAELRPIDLFADLSDEELQAWCDAAVVKDASGNVVDLAELAAAETDAFGRAPGDEHFGHAHE